MSHCSQPLPSACLQPPAVVNCIFLHERQSCSGVSTPVPARGYDDLSVVRSGSILPPPVFSPPTCASRNFPLVCPDILSRVPPCPWPLPPCQPMRRAKFIDALFGRSSTTWILSAVVVMVIPKSSAMVVTRQPVSGRKCLGSPETLEGDTSSASSLYNY